MSILHLMATSTNIGNLDPAFARIFDDKGTRAGREASDAYRAKCAAEGRDADPVMADIIFQRAKCEAEGRTYFAGD